MKVMHVVESMATGTLAMVAVAASCTDNTSVVYSSRPETPKNVADLFPGSKLYVLPINKLRFVLELRKIIQIEKPEIIHLHSSFGGALGRIALSTLRIAGRVFYSPHCISFMRKDIGPLKRGILECVERLLNTLKPVTYLACTLSEKSAIESSGLKACLLENAVPDRFFELPVNNESTSDVIRVITVGGIRLQKGILDFSAISRLVDQSDFEFLWVGDGDEALKEQLKDSGVKVLGWKSPLEVKRLLQSSDIYVSTSRWEGMPVSVIEAQAMGLPCLLSNCAGNVDLVQEGENGYIFSSTNEAVSRLSEYKNSKWVSLNKPTISELKSRFGIERYEKALNEFYKG